MTRGNCIDLRLTNWQVPHQIMPAYHCAWKFVWRRSFQRQNYSLLAMLRSDQPPRARTKHRGAFRAFASRGYVGCSYATFSTAACKISRPRGSGHDAEAERSPTFYRLLLIARPVFHSSSSPHPETQPSNNRRRGWSPVLLPLPPLPPGRFHRHCAALSEFLRIRHSPQQRASFFLSVSLVV